MTKFLLPAVLVIIMLVVSPSITKLLGQTTRTVDQGPNPELEATSPKRFGESRAVCGLPVISSKWQ